MGYASQSGRARTSATSPQAHAICDRCGFRYNFVDLSWQFEWRGSTLQNVRILVCRPCMDKPQEQLRAIVLPADPLPIVNARVQDFDGASNDFVSTTPGTTDSITGLPVPSGVILTTPQGNPLIRNSIGAPQGESILGQAPLVNSLTFETKLSPTSITSNGSKTISMTFSAPHGQVTGAQIGVLGSGSPHADGIFTITVLTATLLTYTVGVAVAAASLLNSTTIVQTANVGVPYNAAGVPQAGV